MGEWNTIDRRITERHRRIPFIRRGDSAYVIVEGPTWEEAEANAAALGGHLVTINDEDEDIFLSKTLGLGHWIGLSDHESEGDFVWSSGEDFNTRSYSNWWDNYQPDNENGIQHYVWYHPSANGEWDDVSLDRANTGIAEIP